MSNKTDEVLAIKLMDHEKWGCPYCGYRSGYHAVTGNGATLWICGECKRQSVVVGNHINESPFSINGIEPQVVSHPRQGIPKHGRPDSYKDGVCDFNSRGIGLEVTPGCFICGGRARMLNNIAAFVPTKSDGEHVVAMFRHGAKLDYREHSPDRVQVKIGACVEHLPQLELLDELTENGTISQDLVNRIAGYSE